MVVESFFAKLAIGDMYSVGDLLAEDVVYVNVGLLMIRGRCWTIRVFLLLMKGGWVHFEVYLYLIAIDGLVVFIERIDVFVFGLLWLQFWVFGCFDVYDGQIILWRDAFDFWDINKVLLRGLLGMLILVMKFWLPVSFSTAFGWY